MQKIILLLTLLIAILLHNTCSESTAPPPPPDNEPDTTSHDIFWQVDTIGSYNSVFRDVAVINDSLIWAVGEIYDEERNKYGAAIWNGSKWSFKYFRLPTMSGGTIVPYGIWAFDKNNIWLPGGHIFKWDGSKFYRAYKILDDLGGVYRVWASSENDVWFVGYKGRIIHYDGSSFTTMEKLTDIELKDVWGSSANDVWTCGEEDFKGTVILHYDGQNWSKFHELNHPDQLSFSNSRISGPVRSIWTDSSPYLWIITFWGLYRVDKNDALNFTRIGQDEINRYGTFRIRGNHCNDIFFCGAFTNIWHYNGKSVMWYDNLFGSGYYLAMDFRDNLVAVVGEEYDNMKALIVRGKR